MGRRWFRTHSWGQFRGPEGLEREEIRELSREMNKGVVGEMGCKDKEIRFHTFNNGKPSEVFIQRGE